MVVTDLGSAASSYELAYSQGGLTQAFVRAPGGLPSGGLCKVVFGPSGYLCVPTDAQMHEYFVGYVPHGYPVGSQFLIQIGGLVSKVRLSPGLEKGDWIALDGEQIARNPSDYPRMRDFAAIKAVNADGTVDLWLLPRTVKEVL